MKIGVASLGCAKNLVDTEIVLGFLAESGHEIVSDPRDAEIIIVNTCGFITEAKEESIQAILEMAEFKESGSCRGLVVMGCLSQRYAGELWEEIPEIDAMLGTNELDLVPEVIQRVAGGERVLERRSSYFDYNKPYARLSTTGSHLAYLKIAEGCSHRCAFCVIPHIRGEYRSRTMESILREAETLQLSGVKELCVIAQDSTTYGKDLGTSIVELLQRLAGLEIPWIRLLYTYPTSISDDLLDLMAREQNLVKYVDLPLQHVSQSVLRRMKRPGGFDSTKALIEKIRDRIPGVVIRSSFIVGFPGETEEDFQELLRFLDTMRLDHVGIFRYSREENSAAYHYEGQVDEEIKERRYHEAMAVQQQVSASLNRKLVGRKMKVLLEYPSEESDLVMVGRHSGQAPDVDGVVYLGRDALQPGELVTVRITEAHAYDLVGEVVEGSEPA
ncbi:MAG: 30S ribosomal protein S12 methylthiotransferase RimO [Bacillota bacterium]|jgi:ribosomal protein S12 methylthiotransferase|nr:30S ribosomal protein S12 methylthiotransferase RimO [Bacillota bacterium]